MTRRAFFLGLGLSVIIGTMPASASACPMRRTALRAEHACCAASISPRCATACVSQRNGQQDLRAATTGPTLKTFSNTIAYHDLTAPAIQLASAGVPTESSPAPVPRRYLRTCSLRL